MSNHLPTGGRPLHFHFPLRALGTPKPAAFCSHLPGDSSLCSPRLPHTPDPPDPSHPLSKPVPSLCGFPYNHLKVSHLLSLPLTLPWSPCPTAPPPSVLPQQPQPEREGPLKDGNQIMGPPSGRLRVPFPCDRKPHSASSVRPCPYLISHHILLPSVCPGLSSTPGPLHSLFWLPGPSFLGIFAQLLLLVP